MRRSPRGGRRPSATVRARKSLGALGWLYRLKRVVPQESLESPSEVPQSAGTRSSPVYVLHHLSTPRLVAQVGELLSVRHDARQLEAWFVKSAAAATGTVDNRPTVELYSWLRQPDTLELFLSEAVEADDGQAQD